MFKTLLAAVVAGAFLISVPVVHAEDKAPAAAGDKAEKGKKDKKDKTGKTDEAKKEEKAGAGW